MGIKLVLVQVLVLNIVSVSENRDLVALRYTSRLGTVMAA